MDVAGHVVGLPQMVALGLFVGFIAGMFGVGGGFLLTPLLGVVFQIPLPIAVGTGLCQMIGSSMVATLRYRKLGKGEPRFAAVLVVGSIIGVATGARVVTELRRAGSFVLAGKEVSIATVVLYAAFTVFLLFVTVILQKQSSSGFDELEYIRRGPFARWEIPPFIDLPNLPMQRVSVVVIAYVGLVLGFVSGLLGVGGGMVLIPILLYGYGFPFRQATGTGIVVTLVTSVLGTIAHARADNVHLGLAMVLLAGSGISAQIGAIVTGRLPARRLRKGLILVILATIGAIVWDLGQQLTRGPE